MAEKITAVLLDPANNSKESFLRVIEIEPELESYYKTMDCSTISMPSYKVGGKEFTFICDDDGLLKGYAVPVAISPDYEVGLVGKVLITNTDWRRGIEKSLTNEDIALIKGQVKVAFHKKACLPFLYVSVTY